MPQTAFIMELSAAFWIRSKSHEIVRKSRPSAHRGEKDVGVVRLKNGVVKAEDFVFVENIEEGIDVAEK